jgi:hypothetical protein
MITEKYHISRISKKADIENLIKYSSLFFSIIKNIDEISGSIDINNIILLLRYLYYHMCLYSNESYISDNTLKLNVYNLPVPGLYCAFNTFCDNFAFVNEWYFIYKKNVYRLSPREMYEWIISFIDIISKYVIRIEKCLLNINSINPSSEFVDMRQFEIINDFCRYWLEKIRGKHELKSIIEIYFNRAEITEQNISTNAQIDKLFDIYKNIDDIYIQFKIIFDKIDLYFKTYDNKILDDVEKVKTILSTLVVIHSNVILTPKIEITKLMLCNSFVGICKSIFDLVKI